MKHRSEKKLPLASMDANALDLLALVACSELPATKTPKAEACARESLAIQQLVQERSDLCQRLDATCQQQAKSAKTMHALKHQLSAMTSRWQAVAHENSKLKMTIMEQVALFSSWEKRIGQEKHQLDVQCRAEGDVHGYCAGDSRVHRHAAFPVGREGRVLNKDVS